MIILIYNINIISFKIGEEPRQSFEKAKEIYNEYKLSKKRIAHSWKYMNLTELKRKIKKFQMKISID